MNHLFTSESVTEGHPDKVCDQIADAILDNLLSQDPDSHVACEVSAITNEVHIFGEITSKGHCDYPSIARDVIRSIGYTKPNKGFDADSCNIRVDIHEQSPDIMMGVKKANSLDNGAGDQGMMFGFACNETENYMPLPIELAHTLTKQLSLVRKNRILPYLLPDGKAQVTIEYDNNRPSRIHTVVLSAQHEEEIEEEQLKQDVMEAVINPILPKAMVDENTKYFINPTGKFVIGGPAGDSGLTGRKIIADTYGGYSRHGGGSFSGKDPSKVDRSAAYMSRYLAKNIVAANLADKCEIQLSYAIGIAKPISLLIETFGTEKTSIEEIQRKIQSAVDLRPSAIISKLELYKPFYKTTSCYGHFGKNVDRKSVV